MIKQLLIATAAAGLALSAGATQNNVSPAASLAKARAEVKRVQAINDSKAATWLARSITEYYWDEQAGTWSNPMVKTYTFDDQNRVIKETEGSAYTEYTYDSENRLATSTRYYKEEGMDQPVMEEKISYKYDTIIKDYVIEETHTTGQDTYSNGNIITRNADQHVIKVQEYSSYNGGERFYYGTMEIGYGADGKANTIDEYESNDGQIEYTNRMTDIVWENTDGQIVSIEFDDPVSESFFGNNRIKSASISDNQWPDPAKLTVNYDGINYNASLILTTGAKVMTVTYKSTDSNGSYIAESFEADYDDDGNGNYYVDYSQDRTSVYSVDPFGLLLRDMSTTVYHYDTGDVTEVEGEQGTVTYDQQHGYPLEYIRQYKSYDNENFVNTSRTVYSDYFNGIGSIEADNDAPVEYYNLQGVRVDSPANGLYIRRQGNKTTKVFIR